MSGKRRGARQDAEPAERVHLLELAQDRGRDRPARDAVEAVAAGDEVAVQPQRLAAVAAGDDGMRGLEVVQRDVLGLVQHGGAAAVGGGHQVFLDAGLAVGHEAPAQVPVHVDEEAARARPRRSSCRRAHGPRGPCARRGRGCAAAPPCPAPARRRGCATARARARCFSSTTLAMPARSSISESSMPAGPPPMMATCVFMGRGFSAAPILGAFGVRRRRPSGGEAQPLHRRAERGALLLVVGPGPVAGGEARGGIAHRPLVGGRDFRQLVPGQRHRDAQARPRARRPGAGGGRAEAVAQVVDEDLADPVASARSWRRSAPGWSSARCCDDAPARSPSPCPSRTCGAAARPRAGPCRRWS